MVTTIDDVVNLSHRKAVDKLERLWRFHEVDVKTGMWQQGKVAAEAIETGCGDDLAERVGITIGELRRYARIYNLFTEDDMARHCSMRLYHKIAGPLSSVHEYVRDAGETDTASFWLEKALTSEMAPQDVYRAIRTYYGMAHADSWWYVSGGRGADEYRRWLDTNMQHISSEQAAFTRDWLIPLAEIRQSDVVTQADVDRLEHQLEIMGELPSALAVYAAGGIYIVRHNATSNADIVGDCAAPQQHHDRTTLPRPVAPVKTASQDKPVDNKNMVYHWIVIGVVVDGDDGDVWEDLRIEAATHGIILPDERPASVDIQTMLWEMAA